MEESFVLHLTLESKLTPLCLQLQSVLRANIDDKNKDILAPCYHSFTTSYRFLQRMGTQQKPVVLTG